MHVLIGNDKMIWAEAINLSNQFLGEFFFKRGIVIRGLNILFRLKPVIHPLSLYINRNGVVICCTKGLWEYDTFRGEKCPVFGQKTLDAG